MNTPAFVHGWGTAVPQASLTQAETAAMAQRCVDPDHDVGASLVRRFFGSAGVNTRHVVIAEPRDGDGDDSLSHAGTFYPASTRRDDRGPGTAARMEMYEHWAPRLAIEATTRALETSSIDARDCGHLVTVSCSGFSAPGVDIALIRELGLSPDVSRTHIGFMGCHGLMNGLRVATALAHTQPHRPVIVSAVELCSLHFQYGAKIDHVIANSLFADGAASLLISATASEPMLGRFIDHASCVIPATEELMHWKIGDHGFEMHLAPTIPDCIQSRLRPWMVEWLSHHDLTLRDVGGWVVHPGGPRILDAVRDSLDLAEADLAASRTILETHGNMSSATVLFILDQCLQTRRDRDAGPVVMLAFGPGLTIEAALFDPAD